MKHTLIAISKQTSHTIQASFPRSTIEDITLYNVFDYAWDGWMQYINVSVYPTARMLILGINPGPHGMLQTGVPFGNISTVKQYITIHPSIQQPHITLVKRPVLGMNYTKEEQSGCLLWGTIRTLFPNPVDFFSKCFVLNYCPLAFFSKDASNLTPDKLPSTSRTLIETICSKHLDAYIQILQTSIILAVGRYTHALVSRLYPTMNTIYVPHPSPLNRNRNDCKTVLTEIFSTHKK